MLFNSITFLIFFPLICVIYYTLPAKKRWVFLLIASYYFYMNWQPVYALLILGSTLVTYGCGILLEKYKDSKIRQKQCLILSFVFNFGVLFIFKYYNFINSSVFSFLDYFGLRWPIPNFDILLPIGISFYTFQSVGYTIDVYRGTIKAERHFGIYALFVSFFPQLAAGPIGRAPQLIKQFYDKHVLNYDNVSQGFRMMLWGYFMKLCVADRLSMYVDAVYNNIPNHNGTSLLLAAILFSFQIYCDFAGYSLMAIGAAKIMGFDLVLNFKRPYFSRSMGEFWKRWHISLSTWFRDYVYIPLGGNRVSLGRHLFNLFLTFLISGLWHGANWTFIVWGAIHGLFLIFGVLKNKFLPKNNLNPMIRNVLDIILTFAMATFAWIFFKANNISDAFEVLQKIFTTHGFPYIEQATLFYGLVSLFLLIIKDLNDEYGLGIRVLNSNNIFVKHLSEALLICFILLFGVLDGGQFIYFQF